MKTRVNFLYALFVLLATVFFTFTNTMAEAGVAAPSSLAAEANSSSRINLTWQDNSYNESGFHLWRYDSSWSQIAVVGANRTSYSDTGLIASAKYRYALRAYDSTGTSSWSNIVSEATLSGGVTAPAAPSNLTAGAVSSSQINLSWQDDAGNESGFHIWRYDSSWKQIAIVGANRTSYSDTGLSTSMTCRYAVRAYNSAGASRWSNVVSATTSSGDVTIPAVPSSLTAGAVSSSQINISWQDNANNESGFKIERASSSSGPWSPIATLAANLRFYADAGLSASMTYYYRVRAYNPAGNSSYSNAADATTLDAADTTAPTVSISSPSSGTTYTSARTVTITAAASDNKGVTRVDFLKDGAVMDTDSTNAYSTTWNIDSADNGSHSWTARAYDAAGNVKMSSSVSLMVNIAIPDTTPPTVSITSPSSGTTYTSARTVTIMAAASDNKGVTRVDFLKDGAVMATDSTNAYSTTWSIDSADNGSHSWTARAYDAAGNVKKSSSVSLTVNIADTTPPTVSITSPSSGATYTSAQTVGITASASDNKVVTQVRFYDGSTLKGTDTAAPYTYSWAITQADNGSHSWTARAYDAAGNNTSDSINLNVNIPVADTTAPTVDITNPSSGSTYTSARTVTLAASASDNQGVTKVEFYNGGVLKGSDASAPYSHAWSVTEADNGTHSWTAKAYDAAGNMGSSSPISLTVDIGTTVGGDGEHLWSLALGGDDSFDEAVGMATVVDALGNTFVAASLQGTGDFGGSLLVSDHSSSAGDLVVAKYTADGIHRWSRLLRASNGGVVTPSAMAADSFGDVIVVGYFQQTVNLGGGALSSAGGYDIFVAKYSSDGAHLWSHRFGGTAYDRANGVAVDLYDDILVTGYFQGAASFGGASLISAGGTDAFLAKYDADGQPLWSLGLGGSSTDVATAVAVDGDLYAVITGYFQGTGDFGGGPLTSAGGYDIFVASFSGNGDHDWSRRYGGTGRDEGRGIGVDGNGDIVLAAAFQESVSFGGAALTSAGLTDIVLAKYSVTGAHQWSKRFGARYDELVNGVTVNASGDIAITGTLLSSVDFGGGYLMGNGSYDAFVAKFSETGVHRWSKRAGKYYDDHGNAVAIDEAGEVAVTGDFVQSADFGGGELINTGGADGFLVRFAP